MDNKRGVVDLAGKGRVSAQALEAEVSIIQIGIKMQLSAVRLINQWDRLLRDVIHFPSL